MPSILTPKATGAAVRGKRRTLEFWKQIVPTTPIYYTDPATKQRVRLDFDDPAYHADLRRAFDQRLGPDTVAFQLADSKNGHGRDLSPEQQRGVVRQIASFDELPAKVQAKIQESVTSGRTLNPNGTYARIAMFDEQAAGMVEDLDLAVSARIREGFVRADGVPEGRAVIHVCGTLDSQVVGMSPWTQADLSVYLDLDGAVLDLSNTTYQEAAAVAKNKGTNTNSAGGGQGAGGGGTATLGDPEDLFDPAQLADLTDEELQALAAEMGVDISGDLGAGEGGDGGEDPNAGDPEGAGQRQLVGAGAGPSQADLSNPAYRVAVAAHQRAEEALAQLAAGQWTVEQARLIDLGVPPAAIALAQPYLSEPGGFTVDLSNADGSTEARDVAGDFRKLLGMLGGYVDLANEAGHGGQFQTNTDADPDQPALDAWEKQFPS